MDVDLETHSSLVAKLSQSIGTTEPALKLLISLFAGYPLALIHRKFVYGQDAIVQHLYCFLTGLLIGYWNYGVDIMHPMSAVLFTYLTLVIAGGTAASVAIVFIFNMGYLLLGYYYTGTENYDINWTMPQCVMVLRLIGLAFDVYDGHQPKESLSSDSKKVALQEQPAFLEVLGYTFFPASFLVGPQFPLKRYQEFVAGKFSEGNLNVAPDSVSAALGRFSLGVLYLAIFQALGSIVWDEYLTSDDFYNSEFLKKCFYLGIWGRFTLYKYISCWLLTEGACVLFGITYNGKDENGVVQWNGVENVKVYLLETASEFNHYILSFNINTNHWVAQYIYKRLKFLGHRLYSQAAALLFLAIWHGFHSGYYICFAFEFMVMYLEKDLKPIVQKNESASNFVANPIVSVLLSVLLRVYTFVFMGYSLLPFALLTFDRYWKVYQSVYFIGFLFFGLYPVIYGPLLRILLKKSRKASEN